jgi:hypothetical protein
MYQNTSSTTIFFILLFLISMNINATNYFPHHKGDIWVYVFNSWDMSFYEIYRYEIIFDSTDQFGNSYIRRETINSGDNYFLIDSLGDVYMTRPDYTQPALLLRTKADVGESWPTGENNSYSGINEFISMIKFGIETTVMNIDNYFLYDDTLKFGTSVEEYSDKFGLIWRGGYETFGETRLAGAFIDGVLYGDTTTATSIEPANNIKSSHMKLYQNYPNPCNPNTTITFILPRSEHVLLEVYNSLGQKVKTLINKNLSAGEHRINFSGGTLGSGVYIYIIQTSNSVATRKMLYIK